MGDSGRFARSLGSDPALRDVSFERTSGAADTLRRVRALPCDLVVTDRSTSVPEDLALAEELRLLRPGVPMVVVVPAATPKLITDAMRSRVLACLVEPVDEPDLAAIVRRALTEPDWNRGIEVVSARPGWMAVRANCRLLSRERLARFFERVGCSLPEEWHGEELVAFREVLRNAMEHGGSLDPDKAIEVSAVRTQRAIVYYVRDAGRAFRPDGLRAGFDLLIVRHIVDEVLFSEAGDEVMLVRRRS